MNHLRFSAVLSWNVKPSSVKGFDVNNPIIYMFFLNKQQYCDMKPESRNSEVRPDVHF
jgi:hypothetical protein